MAKFILCQAEDTDTSLEVPLGLYRNTLAARPVGFVDRPYTLLQLAAMHFAQFEKGRDKVEGAQAETLLHEAMELSSIESHEKRAATFVLELHARRRVLPVQADGESSVEQDSTSRITDDDPWTFSVQLLERFQRFGDIADLQQGIAILEKLVRSTSLWDDRYLGGLANLGAALSCRFKRLGQLSDLEDAISMLRDVVDLTPHGHTNKPARLNNLGNSFRTRFERLGELSDLEDAISRQRDAVDLIPHGHPHKPTLLNNLGNSFSARFEHLGELCDLEDAISRQRNAVDLTPRGHPDKPGHLYSLGTFFHSRFLRFGELSDLEGAISTLRDAVDLTPRNHPHKPSLLNGLGSFFHTRFRHVGELSDLEDAISTLRDAVDLTPHGHPHKPGHLDNLGNSFITRFKCFGEVSDLEQAISMYLHAASAPVGPIRVRFRASQNWISCARCIRHHSLLHAHSVAIGLLPDLAWIGLSFTHRYSELIRGATVACEAAAAALDSGLPETAVEWLEQGRSIVWGELFQLRSSYGELSSVHPDHCRKLRELSTALEQASATREKSLSSLLEQTPGAAHRVTDSLQQDADRHRILAIERDKLLREIRSFPGFEKFLLRKEFSQLRASAHSGPVVILNAAESRCDALIVLADVDHVIHVPLPAFTFQRSAGLQNILEKLLGHTRATRCDDREGRSATRGCVSWEPFLSTLWNGVVKPVLDALAFSVRHVASLEFVSHLSIHLGTDSWGPLAHFLVSDWPFRVSSYPCSWFLWPPAFPTWVQCVRLCHLVLRPYS